jgi:hypothetical protein
LTSLGLDSNEIGDVGTIALSGAFVHTPLLSTLYLESNEIGDSGVISLADGLTHTPQLRVLTLRSNSYGEIGKAALDGALVYESLPVVHFRLSDRSPLKEKNVVDETS